MVHGLLIISTGIVGCRQGQVQGFMDPPGNPNPSLRFILSTQSAQASVNPPPTTKQLVRLPELIKASLHIHIH